ncbi:hypothetical protein [Hoeflea sp.]|uniref:hypothetical protein n=1 Tax=Hoeflea sp. TaxID=1940281 RepID=UPI0025BCB3D0|nr:hypothetical protein [Hoeflea sp.]
MHKISIRQRPDLKMVRANWKPGCVRCNAIEADRERRGGGPELSGGKTGPDGAPFSAVYFNSATKNEVLP